ncbi:MAG: hypothetical protein KGY81_03185, partial [Phycisphaerae bacterium]|nr:hypothetical protein [Phycisphaerae bacterium]
MRTATSCLLLIPAVLLPAARGWAQPPGVTPAARAELKPTWFNPQTPQPGQQYPLAVVLESGEFSGPAHTFWVSALFTRNYCQCIVKNTSEDWSAL